VQIEALISKGARSIACLKVTTRLLAVEGEQLKIRLSQFPFPSCHKIDIQNITVPHRNFVRPNHPVFVVLSLHPKPTWDNKVRRNTTFWTRTNDLILKLSSLTPAPNATQAETVITRR
jgi:hypothetical protein